MLIRYSWMGATLRQALDCLARRLAITVDLHGLKLGDDELEAELGHGRD